MNTRIICVVLILSCLSFGVSTEVVDGSPAEDNTSLQFIVIGDWGTPGSEGQKLVAAQMNALAASSPVAFIVTTGDNFYERGVQSTDDSLWRTTFENIYSLPALKDIPWYVTLGNHDYRGDIQAQIEYSKNHPNWNLPGTYHTRDFKVNGQTSVRILFLDTNPFIKRYRSRPDIYYRIGEQDAGAQIKWMKETLGDSDALWKIAVGHHPVYSAGHHGNNPDLQDLLPGLFEQYKVQAYFAGHEHHLEHSRSAGHTRYYISGGGSRSRPVSKPEHSRFATSSLGFAHVTLDSVCMQVSFINERGEELYQTRQSFDSVNRC